MVMFRNLEGWHIVILLIVVLLLFGSKRLPDAARGLGRSLRILKAETQSLREESKPEGSTAETQASPAPPAPTPVPPVEPTTPSSSTGHDGTDR